MMNIQGHQGIVFRTEWNPPERQYKSIYGNHATLDAFTPSKTQKPEIRFASATQAALKRDLLANFNQPVISQDHLDAWLNQFEPKDRRIALKLMSQINFHSYPQMVANMKQMHGKVQEALIRDGFITAPGSENPLAKYSKVDFSKIYVAKSGDLVSFMYRKANKLPGVLFKDIDALTQTPGKQERALVILDDYIGTGVQFLLEYYANQQKDLFSQYQKIYFVVVTAHEKALDKFQKLATNNHQAVAETIIQEFPLDIPEFPSLVKDAMKDISGKKLELIALNHERPLLSDPNSPLSAKEKEEIRKFLVKYNVYKYPFGVGNAQGHTTFFYSAPNTLPDMFWNTKARRKDGTPWLPLFQRTEDISIYYQSKQVPPAKQVW